MSVPTQVFKAQATGNDFVMYADPDGEFEPTPQEIRWLCDRHLGIGADGLLRLTRPGFVRDVSSGSGGCDRGMAEAEWFMDYRNADGSVAQMCGNGTRAITLFAQHCGLLGTGIGSEWDLGTRAGVKHVVAQGDDPLLGDSVFTVDIGGFRCGPIGEYQVAVPGVTGTAPGTYVDMGNPHVVSILGVPDSGEVPPALARLVRESTLPEVRVLDVGTKPVVDPSIPGDQNVEFVQVTSLGEGGAGSAFMRVNERGCGETLSCGTGLCATAATLHALTGVREWGIAVRGGHVRVGVSSGEDLSQGRVRLTGGARIVGKIELQGSPR